MKIDFKKIKIVLFSTLIFCGIFSFAKNTLAASPIGDVPPIDLNKVTYTLLEPLPFVTTTEGGRVATPVSYITGGLTLVIALAGVLAVLRIIIGGFQYVTAEGFGQKSSAKETIQNSILGLLLAIGSYSILYTLNDKLVNLNLSLEPIPITKTATPGVDDGTDDADDPGTGALICKQDTWPQIAEANNEPFPAQNSTELNALISCIKSNLPGRDFGSEYTIDNSHPVCNYTRGQRTCSQSCSHAVNSCHYGGSDGTQGAYAVDFGNELNGNAIIDVALNKCGAKSARCENASGETVNCVGGGATHVHVNSRSCKSN